MELISALASSRLKPISPLKGWLTRSTNELKYLAAKVASQLSCRQAAAILHELLPVDLKFGHVSVRNATLDAGGRSDRDQIIEPFADWRRPRPGSRTVIRKNEAGVLNYGRWRREGRRISESNRILGVNTAQWRKVNLQAQLQMTRLDAEGADRCCFGIEQSIFAAPHTPNFRLLSQKCR